MSNHDADRIARLEFQVARLYQHLGLSMEPSDAPPAPFGGAPGPTFGSAPAPAFAAGPPAPFLPPSFDDALRQGKMIEAIKIYRQATGAGLAEAKSAVEAIMRNGGR